MSKTMPLAHNYDSKKTPYPAIMQRKYDGVPIVFRNIGGHILAISRQNEIMTSVDHIREALSGVLNPGDEIIAECLVRGVNTFKEASGIIRRKNKTDIRIYGVVFDGSRSTDKDRRYIDRTEWLRSVCYRVGVDRLGYPLSCVVHNEQQMLGAYDKWLEVFKAHKEDLEGAMLHHTEKPYVTGKRLWGMSRYKPQPTIDLEVVGYEEAVSEAGEPLGMVGRVNVRLRRRAASGAVSEAVVGVGPGKLTHDERRAVWQAAAVDLTRPERFAPFKIIAEIKYMPDPSYDALRQPTFQRWRPDKTEPDILEY